MTGRVAARDLAAALACAVAGGGVALLAVFRAGVARGQWPALAAAAAALVLLLIPVAALSLEPVVERLRRLLDGRPLSTVALAGGLVCPYLLYWAVAAQASPGGLFGVAAYAGTASLLAVALPLGRSRGIGDLLVVLALWLPVELRWLSGSFPWPEGGTGSLLGGLLGLDLLLYLMLVARRLEGVGYSLVPRRRELPAAVGAFGVFLAVAAPIGLLTGFVRPGRAAGGVPEILGAAIGIFFFTGIPEETLFRGFVQGLLERWSSRPWAATVGAAVVFGAAHLNNGPRPDWRYALLATLAGVAYGWVYQKTRRVAPAALTHALVDLTWVSLFRG
jgi:hypothetical protein